MNAKKLIMYITEQKTGEWFASESQKEIKQLSGDIKNLWYQPFSYKSGVMSDFMWKIKDGIVLENEIPMRKWKDELPLSKVIEGGVEYLGRKEPRWYLEVKKNK